MFTLRDSGTNNKKRRTHGSFRVSDIILYQKKRDGVPLKKEGLFMKYDAVIFDLDGTILSTLEDLADGTNYALKANGLP